MSRTGVVHGARWRRRQIERLFNPFPKYFQIREILRVRLQRDFRPGDRFPTEFALKEEFGVSRETIREALLGLEQDGWISRHAGQGTFVSRRAAPDRETRLTGLSEGFREIGLELRTRFLRRGPVVARGIISELSKVEAGSKLHRIVYLQSVEGRMLSYTEAFLPAKTGPSIAPSNSLERGLIREVQETLSTQVWEDQQRVEAEVANAKMAEYLELAEGAPLLVLTRLMLTTDKNEFAILYRSYYASERYYYSLKLPRPA